MLPAPALAAGYWGQADADVRCTETSGGRGQTAVQLCRGRKPRQPREVEAKESGAACHGALEKPFSTIFARPPQGNRPNAEELQAVQPALRLVSHRPRTVGTQPQGEIGAIPPATRRQAEELRPAQPRNPTASSAATTTHTTVASPFAAVAH
jgi:hypothetical protein